MTFGITYRPTRIEMAPFVLESAIGVRLLCVEWGCTLQNISYIAVALRQRFAGLGFNGAQMICYLILRHVQTTKN